MYNICIAYVAYAVALVFLRHNSHDTGPPPATEPPGLWSPASGRWPSRQLGMGHPYWWYLCVSVTYYICMFMYVYIYIYHENNEWHVIYCKIIWMYKCISVMCVCASKRLWFIVSFRCSMIERDKAWENTHTHTKYWT